MSGRLLLVTENPDHSGFTANLRLLIKNATIENAQRAEICYPLCWEFNFAKRAINYALHLLLRHARYAMPSAPRPKIAIEVGSGTAAIALLY